MNFFDQQEQARRATFRLFLLFIPAVLGVAAAAHTVIMVSLAATGMFWVGELSPLSLAENPAVIWQSKLVLYVIPTTIALICIAAASRIAELRRGGGAVAVMLGGRKVQGGTEHARERQLLNVVDEMSIAAGTTPPQVYILDREPGINAFAAGYGLDDAAVAVTRGTLQHLTRDELQAVIAHEFSHILNGDMRLNMRVIGMISGLTVVSDLGRFFLPSGSDRSSLRGRSGNFGLLMLGVGLLIVGSIGVLFARLLKAAISREREYLADASAIQFTRDPGAVAGTLKKIGGLGHAGGISSPWVESVSHLFFADAFRASSACWFSTHPSLVERIRRIEPRFRGVFPRIKPLPEAQPKPRPDSKTQPAKARLLKVAAARVIDMVAAPTPAHLERGRAILQQLPTRLHDASRDPYGASALVLSLLLDPDPKLRESQLQVLKQRATVGLVEAVHALAKDVRRLDRAAYLPLVDLSTPALRDLSASQYAQFKKLVDALVMADEKLGCFEYLLQKVLRRHLDGYFSTPAAFTVQFYSLKPLIPDCVVVLNELAAITQKDPTDRMAALSASLGTFVEPSVKTEEFDLPKPSGLGALDRALDRLGRGSLGVKQRVLRACATLVLADREVTIEEGEMLRAIADVLDCPIPAFLS